MDRTITVSGTAEVKKAPELAHFSLNVTAIGKTAKAAREAQSELMHLVHGTLLSFRVAAAKIKTQRFEIKQNYKYDEKSRENVPDGFNVNQQLMVVVDFDEATELTERLSHHPIQISVGFVLKDHDEETHKALKLAIANARAKAGAMAAACKCTVGNVISCTEAGSNRGGGARMMALSMASPEAGGGAPAMPSGEIEVHASVTMQYQICEIAK